jgi:hypothetical protein
MSKRHADGLLRTVALFSRCTNNTNKELTQLSCLHGDVSDCVIFYMQYVF